MGYAFGQWHGLQSGAHSACSAEEHAPPPRPAAGSRFAVVYHLLSVSNNQRLRVRVKCADEEPAVDSVVEIWASANWFEREAFDLFGVSSAITRICAAS